MKISLNNSPRRPVTGFTLIELLTVIALVGILAAILIPAIGKVRLRAIETKKVSTYRQYFVANTMYASEHKGFSVVAEDNRDANQGNVNWRHSLAPYLSDTRMSKAEINQAEIYACPLYKDLHPDAENWETGIGLNLRLRIPYDSTSNAFWKDAENWDTSGETLLGAITHPERRLFMGDVSEMFSFGNVDRLDTTRHNGNTGMFVRFDGSVDYLTQAEAELAFTDPSKRYTPKN